MRVRDFAWSHEYMYYRILKWAFIFFVIQGLFSLQKSYSLKSAECEMSTRAGKVFGIVFNAIDHYQRQFQITIYSDWYVGVDSFDKANNIPQHNFWSNF